MSKYGRLARELFSVNRRFLRDPGFRTSVRPRASTTSAAVAPATPRRTPEQARSRIAYPPRADLYEGLGGSSLELSRITTGPTTPCVNLVLADIVADGIFAGVRTALQAGASLADATARPLRIVLASAQDPARDLGAVRTLVLEQFPDLDDRLSIVSGAFLPHTVVSADDIWVVTYWTTAHAAQVACRLGVLDPDHVVYLVQDYEPGFSAWSSSFALTRMTYHAGFHHLVNSLPLARYLERHEGLVTDPSHVFGPALELDRLAEVAASRRSSATARIFFYGRPSRPRNLYPIGITALRVAVDQLAAQGVPVDVVSAGHAQDDVDLGHGVALRSAGMLSWSDYYALLGTVDVGLSLQHSPHPSHPPFDLAVSGARAVTNDFDGSRNRLHPGIRAVECDPDGLGAAVAAAAREALAQGPRPYEAPSVDELGGALDAAVQSLAATLPSAVVAR